MIRIKKQGITPAQAQLLEWLRAWFKSHDYSPSQREIAEGMMLAENTVRKRLVQLHERGRIQWQPGKHRSILLA